MRHAIVKVLVLITLTLGYLNLAWSGSYEDFFQAIESDNPATVTKLLAKGFNPNTPTEDGQPALLVAVKNNAKRVISVLASAKGIDIDRTNIQDESPLMFAAYENNMVAARILISQGAEVNKTGWSALHYAATKGHIDMIKYLLDHSAYIDAESPNGTTPLMMATQYSTQQTVQTLINAGADPTIKNQLNLTAADFAMKSNKPELASYLTNQINLWNSKHPH
jgi:ankyrin repeat protein